MGVLNDIERAIGHALDTLTMRAEAEAELLTRADAEPASAPACDESPLELNDPSQDNSSVLKGLEQSAQTVDAELQGVEESLRRWLDTNKAIARSLANGGGI
jgi:hypothetical protein